MNKIVKSLLVAALATQAVSAHTNKTFLKLRNQALNNLPLEQTTTKERTSAKLDDRCGGTVTATGFYGQNTKAIETGKYFGVDNKNVITNPIIGKNATITLSPKVVNYGVNLGYNQDLSKLVNGLTLKIAAPVLHAENDLQMTVAGQDAADVVKYLKGEVVGVNVALTNAKINGKQTLNGVANVDVQVGYKFLDKESYNAGLNLGVIIPTGRALTGTYAFEPQVGSKNWGLGAGLDAQARVWGSEEHNVKLNYAANYRYMLQATEKRTLGLKNVNCGQYTLNATTPYANTLTTDLNVTPGSQLDTILGLAYNNGGLNADLGYNMYFAQQEAIKIKGTLATTTADVDATAAETPAQFTNSIYGGIGYAAKEWEYPVMLGLGGKYEFAAKNSATSGWQAWMKAGLSF